MRNIRIVKSGFRAAWTHKLRAVFMVLSVTIGTAALTVILSIGSATQDEVMGRVNRLFSSRSVIVMAGGERVHGMERRAGASSTLKIADVEDIAGRNSRIVSWDAVQMLLDRTAHSEGGNAIVSVYGQMPSAEAVWNISVTAGRFFTESENSSLARVAILAPNVVKRLFGSSDPIRQTIQIDGIPFQVIATVAPRGLDPHGVNLDDQIIVPLNTLLKRIMNADYLMMAKFIVNDEAAVDPVAAAAAQVLRERHHLAPGESDDFMVATPAFVREMIRGMNRTLNLYLPLVALISLLAGALVVTNLMLLSVNERRREIGIRRAVGAKAADISMQFLLEASSITVAGGFLGIILGGIVLMHLEKMMHLPSVTSWIAVCGCVAISGVIGIAAGYLPARRAAALTPVETLR